ncbi:MAG: acyltransferase family protein [Lachnospiraceae bacterium]
MTKNDKRRDYLFDNYKVLLIFLVVAGHFMEPSCSDNLLLLVLKWIIVSFHMPAFIFISGYFSKRELSLGTLIRKLAVPYLVYEVIYYLLYTLVLHKETALYLLRPKFTLWYILALFVWRIFTPYVKKIPHHMILSVAAGLLIGCSGMPDNFLSIPRILVFYPYFLAGIHFDRKMLKDFRNSAGRRLAFLVASCVSIILILGPFFEMYSMKIFYGRYSYETLGQGMIEGIFCRLVCYAVGFVMTFAVLILMTEKKKAFSYIGTRTMAVYLFHGLLYSYLKECTDLLGDIDSVEGAILLLVSCALLTALLSVSQLTDFTNLVADLHFPKRLTGFFRKHITG